MSRKVKTAAPVHVIGVPFSKGQPRDGADLGPSFLRDGGLIDKIKLYGHEVTDHGNIEVKFDDKDPPVQGSQACIKNPRTVGNANKHVADKVAEVTKSGVGVVLGGDHSIAIGSISGDARTNPNVAIFWVDAHADLNTPSTTTSGNIHGMPLSFLIKEFQNPPLQQLPGFEWVKPCISAKDIVHIGLRDVDGPERELMNEYGIKSYSMHEVDTYGISNVVKMALASIDPLGDRPIHVSFDVDGVDPAYTPSTGTAVPGGLTLREALYIAEEIERTGRMSVLDMVEVNPKLGSKEDVDLTIKTTVELVAHFFGKRREGNSRRN